MMKKTKNAFLFFFLMSLISINFGCRQSVKLGTFTQDIQGKDSVYPVKIAGVGQGRYGRTEVGVQSAGGFKTIPRSGNAPIGAYIMDSEDEYPYSGYDIEGDTINFQFDTGIVPDRIVVYPQDSPDDVLKRKTFDAKTREAINFFIPEQFAIDVTALQKQNKIQIRVIGRSMEHTAVSITNMHFTIIPVKIGIGTWFDSHSDDTQNMVTTRDVCFVTEPHKSYTVIIPTACMDSDKAEPDRTDTFTVNSPKDSPENKELALLITLLRQNNISDDLVQQAVWILTDEDVDAIVRDLDEYFGSSELENRILGFLDRFLDTNLSSHYDSAEVTTTKRIIRQVHKPKGIRLLP